MPLELTNFKDIAERDLESLKDNQVPESRDLEYKDSFDLDTTDGRRKLLKQVSSFANSNGGHLIYGIREDKGVPFEVCGISLADPDKTILRIENLVRDSLDPRLSGFDIRSIPLKTGKFAVILRIQKSWNGPHLVKDDGRFYCRHSANSTPMDASELRNAFLQSEAISERIKRHRLERLALIEAGQSPLGKNPHSKMVVHIVPVASFNAGYQINWDPVAQRRAMIFPLGKGGAYRGRLNLDGFVSLSLDSNTYQCDSYLQWFRNGIVEGGDATFSTGDLIYGNRVSADLLKLVLDYSQHMSMLGISRPIIVSCTFVGVKGYRLVNNRDCRSGDTIDRDDLIIPAVMIGEQTVDIGEALHSISEALWNSAGQRAPLNAV